MFLISLPRAGCMRNYREGATMNTKRVLVTGVVAMGFTVALAVPASAAQPANKGCLGHDFAGYARAGIVGGSVSDIASTTPGIGAEIQLHLAGQVPDTVIPNSCND
jgi:hypothetical protein